MKNTLIKTNHNSLRTQRRAMAAMLAAGTSLLLACHSEAFPSFNNPACYTSGCHTSARTGGVDLTGYTSIADLGAGSKKVYQVNPGQTVPIGLNVTSGLNSYILSLNGWANGGLTNSANHLVYTKDSTWPTHSSGTTIFYVCNNSVQSANSLWTFSLAVGATTPPDTYVIEMVRAGKSSGLYNQTETFYLQVVAAAPPPQPEFTGPPGKTGNTFSLGVANAITGPTYYLEWKGALTNGNWNIADTKAGVNGTLSLQDTSATDPKRFYRVRAE